MEIGDRIKRRREQLGISVDELAKKLGKHRATIYRYESDEIHTMPTNVLEPLAAALHTTPAALMGWEDIQDPLPDNILPMPKMKTVPLVGTIACGQPITAIEEEVGERVEVPEHVHADFALRCKGDSMINARIFDGDIVYIRQQPEVENGEIAAVRIDNEATLKRVRLLPDRIILEPANPVYDPLVYRGSEMSEVVILGKAVAFTSVIRH